MFSGKAWVGTRSNVKTSVKLVIGVGSGGGGGDGLGCLVEKRGF